MKSRTAAANKYNKEKTTQICLRLNDKTDVDIIEHLAKQSSKMGYIKELIRKDMGKA
jgi:hypothetical protein